MKKQETQKEKAEFSFSYKMEHFPGVPFIMKLHVDIEGWKDNEDDDFESKKAGYADILILNMKNANLAGENMWELIDDTSINYLEYGDLLFDEDGEYSEKFLEAIKKKFNKPNKLSGHVFPEDFASIAIGYRISVLPEWRGLGVSKQLFQDLAINFSFDMFVARPFPLQHEARFVEKDCLGLSKETNFRSDLKKLKDHYMSCGMNMLPGIKDYLFLFPQRDFGKIIGDRLLNYF